MIDLKCGYHTAVIDTLHGANCMRLRNEKYNSTILRETPANGVLDNLYLYGMPILYPVNRIFKGSFEFEGRKYQFPINES